MIYLWAPFFKPKNKILIKIIAICMQAHILRYEPLYNLMIYFLFLYIFIFT